MSRGLSFFPGCWAFWGGWLTEAARRNNGRKLRFYGLTFGWVAVGVFVGYKKDAA